MSIEPRKITWELDTLYGANDYALKAIWDDVTKMTDEQRQEFTNSKTHMVDYSSYENMVTSIDKIIKEKFKSSIGVILYSIFKGERFTMNKVTLFAKPTNYADYTHNINLNTVESWKMNGQLIQGNDCYINAVTANDLVQSYK